MAKTAILLPSLASGGAERVMLTLSRAMAERGMDVDLVLVRAVGVYLPDVDPRVHLVDLDARRVLQAFPALVRYLRRERPVVVLSSLPHLNLLVVLARAWSRVPARLVLVEHGGTKLTAAFHTRRWERFFPLAMRCLYPYADALVAVSDGLAQELAQIAGLRRERISVIHNPIVAPDLAEKAAAPLDHLWFAPGAPPVIAAAGRLTALKDYPTTLKAFARLRARRSVRLILLGEGELRQELEALADLLGIREAVEFAGFQKNPLAYLSRARVLVLSSVWEGFGNVLVEAMACGTQVVSTDCPGGPAEILENGKYGWLTPVGDEAALADAMEQALDHPVPAEHLRLRAQAFKVDVALEKYLDVMGLGQ